MKSSTSTTLVACLRNNARLKTPLRKLLYSNHYLWNGLVPVSSIENSAWVARHLLCNEAKGCHVYEQFSNSVYSTLFN
jgi:hypothetical protein